MSKKKKHYSINEQTEKQLLEEGYSMTVRPINFYCWRIKYVERPDVFFDWFHTTGATVKNENGFPKRFGTFKDAESLALAIKKYLYAKD